MCSSNCELGSNLIKFISMFSFDRFLMLALSLNVFHSIEFVSTIKITKMETIKSLLIVLNYERVYLLFEVGGYCGEYDWG